MALGIMILSTEGGKQTATMLAADKEEVMELAETLTLAASSRMVSSRISSRWPKI